MNNISIEGEARKAARKFGFSGTEADKAYCDKRDSENKKQKDIIEAHRRRLKEAGIIK